MLVILSRREFIKLRPYVHTIARAVFLSVINTHRVKRYKRLFWGLDLWPFKDTYKPINHCLFLAYIDGLSF